MPRDFLEIPRQSLSFLCFHDRWLFFFVKMARTLSVAFLPKRGYNGQRKALKKKKYVVPRIRLERSFFFLDFYSRIHVFDYGSESGRKTMGTSCFFCLTVFGSFRERGIGVIDALSTLCRRSRSSSVSTAAHGTGVPFWRPVYDTGASRIFSIIGMVDCGLGLGFLFFN